MLRLLSPPWVQTWVNSMHGCSASVPSGTPSVSSAAPFSQVVTPRGRPSRPVAPSGDRCGDLWILDAGCEDCAADIWQSQRLYKQESWRDMKGKWPCTSNSGRVCRLSRSLKATKTAQWMQVNCWSDGCIGQKASPMSFQPSRATAVTRNSQQLALVSGALLTFIYLRC